MDLILQTEKVDKELGDAQIMLYLFSSDEYKSVLFISGKHRFKL